MSRQSKLQSKLFRAYLFLACLILFSFAIFVYIFVSKQLIKSELQALNTLNSSFQEQVDASLKNLDTVSVNINYTNMSKNILDSSFDLTIKDNMLDNMAELFLTISGTDLMADQVNLYDFYGNVLAAGLSTMTKSATREQMELTEQSRALEGSKIITKPYATDRYSKATKSNQWFISLYRSFNNQYGRPVGAIETVKRCKSVFKSVISYQKKHKKESAHIYIFDQTGDLVYPYDTEASPEILKYFDLVEDSSSFRSPVTGHREYASRIYSSYSQYTYLTTQPASVILAPVYHLLHILVGVVLLFLFVSALISYRLSRSVVKPVKHLKHIIQRLEIDTLGKERAIEYPVSVNELEELYQAFQYMSDNMKKSMTQLMEMKEQETKSRFLALQTQMNPHFYYNTLSSICILAENDRTNEVVKMCRNLSMIMRYITNTENITVTLREEIDYVQKYLYCMKVRYQSSLNYTIDIDERLLDKRIPKLVIQPLVENAIKYGSDCNPPWQITIQGRLTDSYWQLDVIDSGNGFSAEAMNKITENIQRADANPGMPDMNINGLGTLNVYLRWKLFCKNKIIFWYGNTACGHGMVSIGEIFASQDTGAPEGGK